MKKSLWIAALVLALTTGVVGTAYAEESRLPPGPGWPGQGDGEGPLHDLMIEAAADVLGLETAELEVRLADGDTLFLYYGAADTSVALASGSIRSLLRWLDEHGSATA